MRSTIDLIKHKRRFDRGGVYMGYYQNIAMAILIVKVFDIKLWWVYVLACLLVFGSRYVIGYFDDKIVLKKEQEQYSVHNPIFMDMQKKLNEINDKL